MKKFFTLIAAQQCVQRTPLARPLTWARFFGVVA